MYILIHPALMSELLEAHAPLVKAFARGEPGAEEVLADALLEHAVWSQPFTVRGVWKAAQKVRDRNPSLNLFVINPRKIRQNVIRAGGQRGWKEIDATARVHRADRIKRG